MCKPVVSAQETSGFYARNRWFLYQKPIVPPCVLSTTPHAVFATPRAVICQSIIVSVILYPPYFQWLIFKNDRLTDFSRKSRFSVNLGGKYLLHYLTIYLIINTLVNIIKLQMCVFFRIFVCEIKNRKAPICRAQRYEEIWIYASNWPDKITYERKMSCLAHLTGWYDE